MTTVGTALQVAASVAADALLAGNPAAPFDRRPLIRRAQAALDDWEANGLASGAWGLSKSKVIARMRQLAHFPERLNQGTLDSCAYICILYASLLRFPEQTVIAARELYERGQADLGGLTLRPSQTLLATTEEMIVADDTAARDDRRAKNHFVPPPLDPADWMLQVALVDTLPRGSIFAGSGAFTGLGASKNGIGIQTINGWASAVSALFRFFGIAGQTSASDIRDDTIYGTLFTDVLTKPNPQVEVFVFLNTSIFPYASMSLTGLHAVVLRGRIQGGKDDGELDVPLYSYGGYEVLLPSGSSLRRYLQGVLAVTIASP